MCSGFCHGGVREKDGWLSGELEGIVDDGDLQEYMDGMPAYRNTSIGTIPAMMIVSCNSNVNLCVPQKLA